MIDEVSDIVFILKKEIDVEIYFSRKTLAYWVVVRYFSSEVFARFWALE